MKSDTGAAINSLEATVRQCPEFIPALRTLAFLLERDVAIEDLTFGPGGAAPALEGAGLGITVDPELVKPVVAKRYECTV